MYKKEVIFFLIGVLSTVHQLNSTEYRHQLLSTNELKQYYKEIMSYMNNRRSSLAEPPQLAHYRNRIIDDFLYLDNKNPLSALEWIYYTSEKYLIAAMTIEGVATLTALRQDAYTIDDAVKMLGQLISDFFEYPEHFFKGLHNVFLANCEKLLKHAFEKTQDYKTVYELAWLYAQQGGEDNSNRSIELLEQIIDQEERDDALDQQKTQAAGGIRYSRVYAVDEGLANQARTLLARLLISGEYPARDKIKRLLQKVVESDYAYQKDRDYAEQTLREIA